MRYFPNNYEKMFPNIVKSNIYKNESDLPKIS